MSKICEISGKRPTVAYSIITFMSPSLRAQGAHIPPWSKPASGSSKAKNPDWNAIDSGQNTHFWVII